MDEEENSVVQLLRLINVQLKDLQKEVHGVKTDLNRLQNSRKISCVSSSEGVP